MPGRVPLRAARLRSFRSCPVIRRRRVFFARRAAFRCVMRATVLGLACAAGSASASTDPAARAARTGSVTRSLLILALLASIASGSAHGAGAIAASSEGGWVLVANTRLGVVTALDGVDGQRRWTISGVGRPVALAIV